MKSEYGKIMCNRRECGAKQNEPPPTTWKTGLHPEKVMLCICWDWKGDLYYQFLLENQTINSNKYYSIRPTESSTSQKVSRLINRKHIIFHQNTTRLRVSSMTRQKRLKLSWEALIHPMRSPHMVPSVFHLFQSLQNSLSGKKFPFPGRL